MPNYDFCCKECGHVHEEFKKYNTEKKCVDDSICPECGGVAPYKPSFGGFKIAFRDGWDVCTGAYHPTQKHYENYLRDKGMVKVD